MLRSFSNAERSPSVAMVHAHISDALDCARELLGDELLQQWHSDARAAIKTRVLWVEESLRVILRSKKSSYEPLRAWIGVLNLFDDQLFEVGDHFGDGRLVEAMVLYKKPYELMSPADKKFMERHIAAMMKRLEAKK